MIVDGKKIAQDILNLLKKKIEKKENVIKTSVFIVGINLATESFVRIKKRKAKEIGVILNEICFSENVNESELIESIKKEGEKGHSIVVQLPLPEHLDKEKILNSIPQNLDVDVLSKESNKAFEENKLNILPPVVGAINEIFKQEDIDPKGKKVVVIGRGALVGTPVTVWLKKLKGANVVVLSKATTDLTTYTKDADIIVTGAGVPNLITPNMIKNGVVLLDAGTSEESGELKGDISPECVQKASIFTPVPGGIGPITVAVLFQNIIEKAT